MTAAPTSDSDGRFIRTPASLEDRPKVAVFGAGIAGLTAAHELAERGFKVTVFEPTPDPRERKPHGLDVRLGGMAATQYLTKARPAKRFPMPDRAKEPPVFPRGVATGEHGFRFFPAYYLHLWDMFQRIPVYENVYGDPKSTSPTVTPRTVYDNVQRVITQAVTALDGLPSLVLPREAPRSMAEFYGAYNEISQLGFTQTDISTFLSRIMRFLVTSAERRAKELEDVSAYEFFVGADPATGRQRYQYSPAFSRQILDMPKILAAFDSRFGDARTNIGTYVQLNMALDRYDSKADGVLNGPTTEAWFDHWYVHLRKLGVEFEAKMLRGFTLDDATGALIAWVASPSPALRDQDLTWDPEALPDQDPAKDAEPVDPDPDYYDYYVVATDALRAELATQPLRAHSDYATAIQHLENLVSNAPTDIERKRAVRTMSTVIGLDGWATSVPPPDPRALNRARRRRNPLQFKQLGKVKWDRFQALSGIQYFFDTEFQIVRGHVYFSNSEWSLSAINQSGFWIDKPNLETLGYVSVMSVDIGDWNTRSAKANAARDCTCNEIAKEVWRQITEELLDTFGDDVTERQLPRPIWYAIDEFIVFKTEEDPSGGTDIAVHLDDLARPRYNRAPYLIPLVGDWKNRPGAYPWNPQGASIAVLPNDAMREMQDRLHVWQAGHGGYEVHHDKLVFAGTWCKTFTRMTSMEAACESGRHAVNAILDHYVYEQSGKKDKRDLAAPSWRMPFGFVDQELSSPIRQPSPAGDYCFIFDCENREPADARPTRALDSDYFRAGLGHPWQVWGIDNASAVASSLGAQGPGVDPYAPALWIVDQLRQWRKLVETVYQESPGGPSPSAPPAHGGGLLGRIGLVERSPDQGGGGSSGTDRYGDPLNPYASLDKVMRQPPRHLQPPRSGNVY
jgi:uncharacterized protein with NAD-binding domain and iron-sulfur cluster